METNSDFGLITPGKLLHDARVSKGLSIEEIASAIKVKKDYILALESDKFNIFDSPIYAKGFLKLYANYLDVSVEKVMALYRRFIQEDVKPTIKSKTEGVSLPKIVITPSTIAIAAVVIVVGFIITYLVIQFASFQKPPKLELTWPTQERTEVTTEIVEISGYTAVSANLYVNDEQVTVSNDGYFSSSVKLTLGDNQVVISATNDDNIGKTNTMSVYIRYVPSDQVPEEPSPAESPVKESFTARVSIEGGEAWIVIEVDGESRYTQTLQPGFSETFTVTDRFSITSGRAQNTKVYIDEELTELTRNNQGIVGIECRLSGEEVVCN